MKSILKIAQQIWLNRAIEDFDKGYIDPRIKLLLKTPESVDIYLVDAKKASYFDTRWMLNEHYLRGDHHWGKFGKYIPEKEIWITNRVDLNDVDRLMFHELFERHLCLYMSVDVDYAHQLTRIAEKNLEISHYTQ